MADPTKVVIPFHSGTGGTALLAEAVRRGAAEVAGVTARTLDVSGEVPWAELAAADALIFGCPTHFGGVSAAFKTFMEASIRVWFQLGWKDKLAAGFVASANLSGDKLSALMQLSVFAAQHGMLWIGLDVPGDPQGEHEGLNRLGAWLGVMAQSDRKATGDDKVPLADLRTAAHLGRRVGHAAKRWRERATTDEALPTGAAP